MLAITASTTTSTNGTRVTGSMDRDRAERDVMDEIEAGGISHDTEYEHVIVSVGVLETLKSLWDNDTPIVRRFR